MGWGLSPTGHGPGKQPFQLSRDQGFPEDGARELRIVSETKLWPTKVGRDVGLRIVHPGSCKWGGWSHRLGSYV